MNEAYDVIVLGTGLKECILSGLLSVDGKKVLHMDRNNYYGGASASLNLNQLYEKFRPGMKPPEKFGSSRDYNVDLIPKFIMANGALVRVLIHTDVAKYLEFKAVDGSYVLRQGKIHKVPVTPREAIASPLMGLFEKRRAYNFFTYVENYVPDEPKTHKGYDLKKMTMKQLFDAYGMQEDTIEFIGHALALYSDDSYLQKEAEATVLRVKLYRDSLMRFDGGSPYIYPLYGLGELPQAFARLSAVYGGTYMLAKPDAEVVYDESGAAIGVKSEGETAQAKMVVGDPSYFPGKTKVVGKVVRAIALMSHPIPNTSESHSVQIILPQRQLGRKNDMYVFCCSYSHQVAAKGRYIAFVSTIAETEQPQTELLPGLQLLGPVDEQFFDIFDVHAPINDEAKDHCFISQSYDATSHFETTVTDVLELYTRITGKTLNLTDRDPTQIGQAE